MNDYNNIYDIIFNINSFYDLKEKGWRINMDEKGNEKFNFFSNFDNENKEKRLLIKVGILGGGKVGKTFILHRLLDKEYERKEKTKGISVIYPEIGSDNQIVYLDTCNTLNTSLFAENFTIEEVYNLDDNERLRLMKELNKDQKIKNIFIEDFIIEKSDIILIVINDLSFKEQIFLNRLKNHTNFEKIFIIHNLQFFCDIRNIEEYIENKVKKSIFSNLEEAYIPHFDFDKNYEKNDSKKSFYFREKNFPNSNDKDKQQKIYHFFMGKEGSEAGNIFNYETIEYIKNVINFQINKRIVDIIDELKDFLSLNSYKYMINEWNEDNQYNPILKKDLSIEYDENEDGKYIICKKDFKLKDFITNEMGISTFYSDKSITPPYICYKGRYKNIRRNEEWPALIIKAQMFVNSKDIKIFQNLNDDNETMNIIISCPKKFEQDSDIETIEEIEGNIKEDNLKIEIKINIDYFIIDTSRIIIKEPEEGIKVIYLKIVDKNNESNIKEEIVRK